MLKKKDMAQISWKKKKDVYGPNHFLFYSPKLRFKKKKKRKVFYINFHVTD